MRRLAALLLAGTLAVAACGDDDDDASTETADTTTTAVAEDETTTTTAEDDVEDTTTTAAAVSLEIQALQIYAAEILRWPDASIETFGTDHELVVHSETYGEAVVTMVGDDTVGWQVDSLFTQSDGEDTASVKLGYPDGNNVTMGHRDPNLTPDLTVAYGDGYANLFVRGGERGGAAAWDVELDPTLDNGPRRITVMWRDDAGAAVKASVLPVPAGEFAAG